MKKIFYLFIAVLMAIVTVSCESNKKKDDKSNIYAESHEIYNKKDSTSSGIIVYYAKVKGHDVIYHVINGKRKCDMDAWHFEDDCAKCKKTKK
jgi:uncharacterized protein YxeA